MTLAQAYLSVSDKIPVSDVKVKQRLDRAYEIVRRLGEGYDVIKEDNSNNYKFFKASTSLLEDTSTQYLVSVQECTCPDFDKARGNLCKHRLAVMLLMEMDRKGESEHVSYPYL